MNLERVCIVTSDPRYDDTNPEHQLYRVPGYPMLAISRSGNCFNLRSNTHVTLRNRNGSPETEFNPFFDLNIFGGKLMTRIDWLLALTFLDDYPEGYTIADARKLEAPHKDGLRGPCSVDNIYWAVPDEIVFNDNSTEPDDKLVQVPSFPFVAVSLNGKVKNLSTGYFVSPYSDPDGYVSYNPIYKGVAKHLMIHRLIGEVFVPPKNGYTMQRCLEELVINHKDAKPSNNHPDNLEWVTQQENVRHAVDMGLFTITKACLCKHITTGEIIKFHSYADLAIFLNLNSCEVSLSINNKSAGIRRRGDYVFKEDNGLPWPDASLIEPYDKWAYKLTYMVYFFEGGCREFVNKFAISLHFKSNPNLINLLGETFVRGHRIVGRLEPITETFKKERAINSRLGFRGNSFTVTNTLKSTIAEYDTGRSAAEALGIIYSTFRSRARKYNSFVHDHFIVQVQK